VAWCRETGVYTVRHSVPTKSEAEQFVLNSARKHGAKNPIILSSSDQPGYGAIFMRRPPGSRIEAIGVTYGAPTAEIAFSSASESCRKVGKGQCAGPKVSWHDTVK
jgi:hypothetical protein